jgi:DNA-binding transcriptional MerR regulator
MVQPVVQPVCQRPKDSLGGHFFRWLRWSAVMMALIPICIVAVVQWQSVRTAKIEADLKQQMLDQGMTAKDIETVLRASADPSRHRPASPDSGYYTAKHAEIESALIKDLATLNISADDIEKIYKAFSSINGAQYKSYQSSEKAIKDAAFVKRLAQSGRSSAEIERLLKVAGKNGSADKTTVAVVEKSEQAKVEDALKTLLKSGLTAEDVTRMLKSDGGTAEEAPKVP